ncbi:hypothetical protein M408DRAFT_294915 [Serendipita vermifera MAFF 305830]|uniref:C2 domain-containing protein n=1 Tax=Serendipita vermifera MAFF 305830 TaxID=933852 RepID=A0A0C2WVL3_SERVB|nr:hypothetical protein M408DRAFT_294915 [Serendipita vermifera MAFF 305830]
MIVIYTSHRPMAIAILRRPVWASERSNDEGYATSNASSSSLGSYHTGLEILPPARDKQKDLRRSRGSLTSTTNSLPLSTAGRKPSDPFLSEPQAEVSLQTTQSHKVKLTVVAVEGLVKGGFFALPDPFAVVTVDSVQTQVTKVIKKTLNPSWDQSFEFTVTESSVIKVQIFDARKFNKKKDLGCVGVIDFDISNVLSLRLGGQETLTFDLKRKYDNIAVKGKIIIRLSTHVSKPLDNQDPFTSSSVNVVKAARTTGTLNPTSLADHDSSNTVDQDGPLPLGWEKQTDHPERIYVDNDNRTTTSNRPLGNQNDNTAERRAKADDLVDQGATSELGVSTARMNNPAKDNVSMTGSNPLSAGQEERPPPEGRCYYVSSISKTTTLVNPRQQQVTPELGLTPNDSSTQARPDSERGPLPSGWEMKLTNTGRVYFVDNNTKVKEILGRREF